MERINFMQNPKLKNLKSVPSSDYFTMEKSRVDTLNALEGDYTGYDCPKCKNKGFIAVLREDASFFVRDCTCMPMRRCIRQMEASGLSRTIKNQTFDTFQATEKWQIQLKEAVSQYAKSPDGWMMIGGQPGSGKTHLCTAVCREILLRGESLLYMPWREYIGKLKALNTDPGERFALLDKCKQTPWLYIDDLFKTGRNQENKAIPTATDINLAFEILNYRYCQQLPTIISSEKTPRDLMDIDDALGSRIIECCGTHLYCIPTSEKKNYRMRNVTVF